MATWTATVVDSQRHGDHFEKAIALSDGVSVKFVQRYTTDGTLANLRPQILTTIVAVQAIDETPIGTVLDTTPIAPVIQPIPTAAEIAQAKFLADYRLLQSMLRGQVAGLPVDAPTLTALSATVKAEYLAAYAGLL